MTKEGPKKPEKTDKDRLETQTHIENIERLKDRPRNYWAQWATEHPEAPNQLPPMARPSRLLSFGQSSIQAAELRCLTPAHLDGGGVRGIISLPILQNIMEQVAPGADARPCDYFDLIGGTSTGGWVAPKSANQGYC